MVKKSLFLLFSLITFNGCGASSGLEYKDSNEIKYEFKKGEIISSNKVIVSKDKLAIINGAIIGSGTGAVIGAVGGVPLQGAIIGSGVGAVGGYFTGLVIDGNEAEAYEIIIRKIDDLKEYKAFVQVEIPNEVRVEFVVREKNLVTNIRIE